MNRFRIFILAVLLAGGFTPKGNSEPASAPSDSTVYATRGCALCHGQTRQGTARGPSLASLQWRYTVVSLVNYLKDPAAARKKDHRLQKLSAKYAPVKMPQFEIPDVELQAVARFLLRRPVRENPR